MPKTWKMTDEQAEIFEIENWRNSGGVAWRDPNVKSVGWYGVLEKDRSSIEESVRQGLTLPSSDGYAAHLPDGTLLAVGDVISYEGIEEDGATSAIVVKADAGACTAILVRHEFTLMRVLYEWGVKRLGRAGENIPNLPRHPEEFRCRMTESIGRARKST